MTPIGAPWAAVWQDGVWDPVWTLTPSAGPLLLDVGFARSSGPRFEWTRKSGPLYDFTRRTVDG